MNENLNKVEPKFHEGDWVVYKNDICQIVKREEGCNKLVTVFGIKKELVNERNLSTARLWTIQDAKDGDVLVDVYGNIGIFEKHDDFDWTSYCSLGCNGGFRCFRVEHENDKTHPATKEQRELLFQKMKEEGYEFDFEKKELKKIEQKLIEWNSDDEQYFLICKNALAKYQISDKWDTDIISRWLENRLKSIRPQPKQEWSKEDDDFFNDTIAFLENTKNALDHADWIKSLKDRVQPKQEWSEEDEERLKSCLNILQAKGIMGVTETINTKWLKSLKERMK